MIKNKRIFQFYYFFLILLLPICSQSHSFMSYNIRYDNNWDVENSWLLRKSKIVDLMIQKTPSVIGIQEGLINQVQFIDSCLFNYDYFGVGREDGNVKGEFCAIYYDTTRYSLKKHSTFWLSETPESISIGWDAALERICTYGLFKDKESFNEFWVFNTHYDHLGSLAREKSSELIIKKIKKVNIDSLPLILMGDFNSMPGSSTMKIIESTLNDALKISLKKLQGPVGTFNEFNLNSPIDKRIDYIFTNRFKVLSYQHINERLNNNRYISDHLSVIVEVQ